MAQLGLTIHVEQLLLCELNREYSHEQSRAFNNEYFQYATVE